MLPEIITQFKLHLSLASHIHLHPHRKTFLFFVFTEEYIKKYPCVDVHTTHVHVVLMSHHSRTQNKNISKLAKTYKKYKTLEAPENAGKIMEVKKYKNRQGRIENA